MWPAEIITHRYTLNPDQPKIIHQSDGCPLFGLNADFFAMLLDCDGGTNNLRIYQKDVYGMVDVDIQVQTESKYYIWSKA